jgi:polysaccharide pyruvyl transferase CsaB
MSPLHAQALAERLSEGRADSLAVAVDPSLASRDQPTALTRIAVDPRLGHAQRWLAVANRLECRHLLVIGCDAPLVTLENARLVQRALTAAGADSVVLPVGMPIGSAPVGLGRGALERLARPGASGAPPVVEQRFSGSDRRCLLGEWVDITLSSPLGADLAREYLEPPAVRLFSGMSLARALLDDPKRLLAQMAPHLPGPCAAAAMGALRAREGRPGGPVVIAGYYGFGNLGDEAILGAILHQLQADPSRRVVVISGDPRRTTKEHGVESRDLLAFDEILPLLAQASLLVIGGGGLLQNAFNVDARDLLEQFTKPQGGLMHFVLLALLARAAGCRVMTWCVGIDPVFREELAVDAAHLLLRLCDRAVVRDPESLAFCEGWRSVRGKIALGADASAAHPAVAALDRPQLADRERQVLVVPRAWFTGATHPCGGADRSLLATLEAGLSSAWASVCDAIAVRGYRVRLAALQTGEQGLDDESAAQAIAAKMRWSEQAEVLRPASWGELLQLASRSRAAICMRLHGALAALLAATPVIGVAYDPKVRVLMESVGMGDFAIGLQEFEASGGGAVLAAFARLEGEAGRICSDLARAADRLRETANVAADATQAILSREEESTQ